MAKKFLTDINIAGGVYDSSGDIGNSGQVLSSTGSGVNWINATSSASIVYQDGFTGDGSTTAFTLANSIDNENKTQVYIDGVYQHKDNYSLSGTTLTFSTAPPNSSDIEVISFSSVSSADDILYDNDFASAGLMTTNGSGVYSITTNNSSNWNTAYGWGDHSTQGYITDGNTNWNNSYGFITSSSTETLTNKSGNISMFTNDSNYATQSYVGTQISNLVDSSPATLDTLNELAAALGDDANFSTTVTNSIALKAPLASPSFTGNATFAGSISTNSTGSFGSTSAVTDRRFQVTGTNTSLSNTTTQFGIVNNPTYPNTIGNNIFNLYTGPNVTSGATLTNLYNLYLESNNYSGSTVTNSFALYQAGSSDKNYFAGNVGIGTTTPYQKLDVVGTIEAGDISATDGGLTLVQRYNAASGDYIGSISTQYSSGAMILGYGARGKNGSGSTSFTSTFDNFSGIRGALRLKNGELSLYSSVSATQATVGSDLTMTNTFVVQSDGNVGIGTTSPASKFEVYGGSTGTNDIDRYVRFKASNGEKRFDFHIGGTGNASRLDMYQADGATYGARISSSGDSYVLNNFGIGTTSPTGNLTVEASGNQLHLRANTATAGKFWNFDVTSANQLYIINNANTGYLTIKDDGNVGIGTASPSGLTHFYGNGNSTYIVNQKNSTKWSEWHVGGTNHAFIWDSTADMRFMTATSLNGGGASEKIRITSGGYVGIGNTSGAGARTKLGVTFGVTGNAANLAESVSFATMEMYPYRNSSTYGMFVGAMGLTSGYIQSANTNGTAAGAFSINPWGGGVGIGTSLPDNILHIETSNAGGPQIQLESTSGTASAAFINFDGTSLQLSTQRDMIDGDWYDTSKSWGGINIQGPAGGSFITFHTAAASNSSPSERMRITSDGMVGIGMTPNTAGSSTYMLQMYNPGSQCFLSLGNGTSGNGPLNGLIIGNDTSNAYIVNREATSLIFATSDANRMVILANGNVGINTTSPDGRLDVRGAISSGMAHEDENVSLTSSGGTPQGTGTLEISQGWSASTSSGDTIVFRHNSTSWKAWILHYNFASTNGVTVGVIGGYWNNSGSSSNTFIENNLGASVAVTHGGTGNQNIIVTFTFTALGTHPLSSFKYIQSGGDGKPLASKTSITLNS